MTNILALDTSTDACSVALQQGQSVQHIWELVPRQHNQRLFSMLEELLPSGGMSDLDVELLAYAEGPGSFTGLRIAASAVQGIAFARDLPVVGISTLALMAQGARRRGVLEPGDEVLVMLDARINEIYWGVYRVVGDLVEAIVPDRVSAPGEVEMPEISGPLSCIGNAVSCIEQVPGLEEIHIQQVAEDAWPDSFDLLTLAEVAFSHGQAVSADQVQPVYLRNEINWKNISEQGPAGGS